MGNSLRKQLLPSAGAESDCLACNLTDQRLKYCCFSFSEDASAVTRVKESTETCLAVVSQDSFRQSQSLVASGPHAEAAGRLPASSHLQEGLAQVLAQFFLSGLLLLLFFKSNQPIR